MSSFSLPSRPSGVLLPMMNSLKRGRCGCEVVAICDVSSTVSVFGASQSFSVLQSWCMGQCRKSFGNGRHFYCFATCISLALELFVPHEWRRFILLLRVARQGIEAWIVVSVVETKTDLRTGSNREHQMKS